MADPDPTAAIAAVAKVAGPADPGGADDVKALFQSLIAARDKLNAMPPPASSPSSSSSSSSSSTWFTRQPNNVTAQGVGSGAAQFLNPSFSALGFGGNLASATYTAFKMDETGIYLFGKKLGNDPFKDLKKEVEDLQKTSTSVKDEITAVKAKFGTLGNSTVAQHLAALGARIRDVSGRRGTTKQDLEGEQQRRKDYEATRDGRIKGKAFEYNKAQIESLERSIELLAKAIGV